MPTRRDFLRASGLLALLPATGCPRRELVPDNLVNDIHSQLNPTTVDRVVSPNSMEGVREALHSATQEKKPLCLAGGRHAMGGQQFASSAVLLDTCKLNRVLKFDPVKGTIEVESGIQWPELVEYLVEAQKDQAQAWGIAQKQTGADRLCLGGALSSNVHGRGLRMRPIIENVESFTLMDAKGATKKCSRQQNRELFTLAIGGYGLFGLITSIQLRLVQRQKVQRLVEIITLEKVAESFDRRIREGFTYGDFQYSIDEKSPSFMREGVFSCYKPVPPNTPMPQGQKEVSEKQWNGLLYLAHSDKAQAYRLYCDYYRSTSGQVYWSDTHQLSAYLDDYHQKLDKRMGVAAPATEVITEIYVPRSQLRGFMEEARADFLKNNVNVIYGTERLIERDSESFLAWAKQPYACVIFNLHTIHTEEGKEHSARAFRRLIDMAIKRGGSYYLTYHRHATKQQVLACYPQFVRFLRLKRRYDPEEQFQSDWYWHYKKMFASELGRKA